MPLLNPGREIRGTYEVERFLGEGAFAEVYRVNHRFLGRQSLKLFKSPGMSQTELEEMLAEAVILSKLGHPNVIRVFDANTVIVDEKEFGYFTMQYIAGGTLQRYWQAHGDRFVKLTAAVEIVMQAARGTAAAHKQEPPIVHRDLTPNNILVGYDGLGLHVRVSDFGLAKHVNPVSLLASAKGTIPFKAPEALGGRQMDSPSSDVWSLGVILYLLLTDRLPFDEKATLQMAHDPGAKLDYRPLATHNYAVDDPLADIVTRCLAWNPQDRYPTADKLSRDMEHYLRRKEQGADPSSLSTSVDPTTPPKHALGDPYVPDRELARQKVNQAMILARNPSSLPEAADLLEEAISQWPALRSDYASRLKLWRRGISM